ncbi:PBP1A family penicillin-binding protein [Pelagibacterium sp. 26DY04]|uniref:transglycosylase domain-containing protein n=1 Tax=Pelagibacterium sp. 26DY04 TaxID=2967130 RepID=UPI0028166DC5|nr:PBP1A family penicillin-binding protein [Pelagibacterium sp. 26DY04]WMT87998.1 PBP1A family penicillin-binding protein [Pelagibacterium sp. 26DY04]
MQDPFYSKQKRSRGKNRLLEADAWLDSFLYDGMRSTGRVYTKIQDFFSLFSVRGISRFLVEIASDALSFGAMGAVLMVALALSAMDATASGEFNRAEDYSVIFLDRYGNEIGRRGIRADDSVALSEIPDFLIRATLATEDRRFYEHFGIDVWGTVRALLSNAEGDSSLQGGSSITQQLAKNLFLSNERTIERKIKELFLSFWLEANYSKDEILKLYLDRAYMGGGNFGVVAAAEYYFGKQIQDIDLAEAAMLAGLYKAPTRFAPHVDIAAARGRANVVLTNMVNAGFLTEGQVTAARRRPAEPVDRSEEVNSPNYFLDWAFLETKRIVGDSPELGFVVRTTIDPDLQTHAEDAIISVLREQGAAYNVSQGAMVVMEHNGAVRAMVGGTDYGQSQFNRATAPNRQPGSAFKPFVYATAFEMLGMTPRDAISDAPVCIGNWCPQNYGRSYRGSTTIRAAVASSINTVPVRLSIETGRQPIADMAHRLGIRNEFPVTRSLALGVASVSALDMASSYAVFANGGYRATGFGITRITTLRGEVVYEANPDQGRERVLDEQVVLAMNDVLNAVNYEGTGGRAVVEGVPSAGKTGTTSSYRDAWYVGYTGNYVASVWYGNDNYEAMNNLTGGTLPAMSWQKFMAYAHSNIEVKPLFGVDMEPRPLVIADAEGGEGEETAPERAPTLAPAAAIKLLDLSEKMREALANGAGGALNQAALPSNNESL